MDFSIDGVWVMGVFIVYACDYVSCGEEFGCEYNLHCLLRGRYLYFFVYNVYVIEGGKLAGFDAVRTPRLDVFNLS